MRTFISTSGPYTCVSAYGAGVEPETDALLGKELFGEEAKKARRLGRLERQESDLQSQAEAQLANSVLESVWSGSNSQGCINSSLGGGNLTGGLAGWSGTYQPPAQHPCPCCGYCPVCGRGGGYVPNYPSPYNPHIPYYVGDNPNWMGPYCGTAQGAASAQGTIAIN